MYELDICNADAINRRKDISFQRVPNILCIALGHIGFFHIPPTFCHELESIRFGFKQTVQLFLLMNPGIDVFRQERAGFRSIASSIGKPNWRVGAYALLRPFLGNRPNVAKLPDFAPVGFDQ